MEQLLIHLWGDYIFQSSWMAANKTKRWDAALIHATIYSIPFLLLSQNPVSLAIIWLTHLLIDRFSLVKKMRKFDGPDYLTVWLSIIADNTVHLTINYLALLL